MALHDYFSNFGELKENFAENDEFCSHKIWKFPIVGSVLLGNI